MSVSFERFPIWNAHVSKGPDFGALALLRRVLIPGFTHASLSELGSNLEGAYRKFPGESRNYTSIIAGHGTYAYVDTGDGAWNDSDDGSIQVRNEALWAPIFERLRTPVTWHDSGNPNVGRIPSFRGIQFLSCSTAAGNGRALMQRIADIGHLKVQAFSGLIFVNKHAWWMERYTRSPFCIPSDADAAVRAWFKPERQWEFQKLKSSVVAEVVAQPALLEEAFSSMTTILASTGRGEPDVSISGADADRVLALTLSRGPFRRDGEIVGSYRLRLVVQRQAGAPLTIQVAGDRIAVTSDGLAFFVAGGLRAELERLGVRY